MKKIVFIFLWIPLVMLSQQRGDKIRAYKAAFITEALDLSASEAEKFWPIYNEHEDQLMALRKKERREVFELVNGNIDNLTEEEANKLLDKVIGLRSMEFEYHKELVQKLKGVLPPKKILKLHRAEEEFKRVLLKKMKGRHEKP